MESENEADLPQRTSCKICRKSFKTSKTKIRCSTCRFPVHIDKCSAEVSSDSDSRVCKKCNTEAASPAVEPVPEQKSKKRAKRSPPASSSPVTVKHARMESVKQDENLIITSTPVAARYQQTPMDVFDFNEDERKVLADPDVPEFIKFLFKYIQRCARAQEDIIIRATDGNNQAINALATEIRNNNDNKINNHDSD